jgi:glycerol-3-phosphate cytidylyltransferase
MAGNSVGYAFGVFDLFNVEHVDLLDQALAHCDELVVGVASDDLVQRSGGAEPLTPEDERLAIVGSVRRVGRVELLDTADLAAAARQAGAQVVFGAADGDAVQRALHPGENDAAPGVRLLHLVPRRRSASEAVRGADVGRSATG